MYDTTTLDTLCPSPFLYMYFIYVIYTHVYV